MEKQFTVLGQPYSMVDPSTLGTDVRIQHERKAYFVRSQGSKFQENIRVAIENHTGLYKDLETLLDTGRHDELAYEIANMREGRMAQRERFETWMRGVEDTTLEDILMACAVLEPIGLSPRLTPEMVLSAPRFSGVLEEITEVISFFMQARDLSRIASLASNQPSETTTEALTPTAEASMPESTSP